MHGARWWMYLWPGWVGAWTRGDWPSLVWAAAAGLALDVALTGSWVWNEWLAPSAVTVLWTATGLFWIVSWWMGERRLSCLARLSEPDAGTDLFPLALDEYLRGDLLAAETHCVDALEQNPRDAEFWLLLASVLRQGRRRNEALTALGQLERLDAGKRWKLEIDAERRRLHRRDDENANESHADPAATPTELRTAA